MMVAMTSRSGHAGGLALFETERKWIADLGRAHLLIANQDVDALFVLADPVAHLADGVIVEARGAAAFSDGTPERTLGPLAERGRVERFAKVAREKQTDALGAQDSTSFTK